MIVDGGNFDFAPDPERFPNYNEPDPSYHGLVYARDLGVGSALGANLAFILKARVQLLRDLGAAVAPFNAFLIAQGLETLSLRIERHVANAQAVAEWLEATRRGRDASTTPACPSQPVVRAGPQKYAPAGRRRGAVLRDQGRRRGRPHVRRGPRAAQPRRQHRRRAQPRHPPGVDHALAS